MIFNLKNKENLEKSNYFPAIDGLRFLAFLLVFIHHFNTNGIPTQLLFLHSYGWIGVELFFVLSSFLLTKLAIKEIYKAGLLSIKKFFIRRILRIWPLYFTFILFMFILQSASINVTFGIPYIKALLPRLMGLLTFTDNLWCAVGSYNGAIPYIAHLWTVSLEEQYYLLIPFVLPFLVKLNKKELLMLGSGILAFFLIMRAISIGLALPHPFIWTLPIQCDAFLLGTLLALGVFDSVLLKMNNLVKFCFGFLFLGLLYFLPNVSSNRMGVILIYTIISISFTLIVDSVVKTNNKFVNIVFANKIARYLGKISYGLYVFHFFAIAYADRFIDNCVSRIFTRGTSIYWLAALSITLLFAILISAISYELFEKRFLIFKKKFTTIESRPI